MAINFRLSNSDLHLATGMANEILSEESNFMKHYTKPEFEEFTPDMSDTTLLNIMLFMISYLKILEINVYKWFPKWRWTKAIAYTGGKDIYINARKRGRPVEKIINTIVHETVHIVDNNVDNRFGHGSNNPKGKEKTAPYLIGRLAQDFYQDGTLYTVEQLKNWGNNEGTTDN